MRDPVKLTVPRQPVTRSDYVDLVRPLAAGFEAGPDRGTYGPRHTCPPWPCSRSKATENWARGSARRFGTMPTGSGGRSARPRRVLDGRVSPVRVSFPRVSPPEPDDAGGRTVGSRASVEFAAVPVRMAARRRLWRGSHHRSQCQGLNHALAAAFYPDEPDVAKWQAYAAETLVRLVGLSRLRNQRHGLLLQQLWEHPAGVRTAGTHRSVSVGGITMLSGSAANLRESRWKLGTERIVPT